MSSKDSPGRRRRQTDFKLRAMNGAKRLKIKRGRAQRESSSSQNIKKSLRRLSKSTISISSSIKNQIKRKK